MSKAWGLIQRLSEDIDLAIDRMYFGLTGDLTPSAIKRLRKKSCGFLSQQFASDLRQELSKFNVPGINVTVREFKDSDTDPIVLEINYHSVTDPNPYLLPRVLVEVGSRSLFEPFENRPVQSFVGITYPTQPFSDPQTMIPSVLPERTFLEKILLLYEEFQKPAGDIRIDRLSRHHSDLDVLMDTVHGFKAINDEDLFQAICEHRQRFNPIKGVNYANHQRHLLNIIPPEQILMQWEVDYRSMRESMIYAPARDFDELMTRMEELMERFKG